MSKTLTELIGDSKGCSHYFSSFQLFKKILFVNRTTYFVCHEPGKHNKGIKKWKCQGWHLANLALLNSPVAVMPGQLFLLEIKTMFDLRINIIPCNKCTGKSTLDLFKMKGRDSCRLKNNKRVIFRQPKNHPSPHAQDFILISSEFGAQKVLSSGTSVEFIPTISPNTVISGTENI